MAFPVFLSAGSRAGPTGPPNTVTIPHGPAWSLRGPRVVPDFYAGKATPGATVLPQAALSGGMGAGDRVAQQESQKALPSQLPRHKKPDSSRGPDPFQIYIPLLVARHCCPTSGCSASSLASLSPVTPLEQSGWWSMGLQLTSPAS